MQSLEGNVIKSSRFKNAKNGHQNGSIIKQNMWPCGRSPGLVVMGDDSCSKGRGFESWRHKLDGHLDIFHIDQL